MTPKFFATSDSKLVPPDGSRLRLQTIVRLRWFAVFGQFLTISFVAAVLRFPLPLGLCFALVAISAWLNVFLAIRYPARHRLSVRFATLLLAYDILQLAMLLYLTGGIDNPFTMLIVAPVTVSAASLPLANTIALGLLAALATAGITWHSWPLPWHEAMPIDHPVLYRVGALAAVISGMTFLALYGWRLAKESRQMSDALAATEHVLAREQKLHALDGLAAAAAHELGTPLSTITVVTKELLGQIERESPYREDIDLLREQAERCREILRKLTRHPSEQDPLHDSVLVIEMLTEAAAPYEGGRVPIKISAAPVETTEGEGAKVPIAVRRPGVIYGIGNIIENAVDFAGSRVDVTAEWDSQSVLVKIIDDGPGFKPEIIDTLGEPYVTTRPAGAVKREGTKVSGLGLGFFIAKTLLERSGARISLENRAPPDSGAIVRIFWSRTAFEAPVKPPETEGRPL